MTVSSRKRRFPRQTQATRRAQLFQLLTPVMLSPLLLWVIFSMRRSSLHGDSPMNLQEQQDDRSPVEAVEVEQEGSKARVILLAQTTEIDSNAKWSSGHDEADWKCFASSHGEDFNLNFVDSVCHAEAPAQKNLSDNDHGGSGAGPDPTSDDAGSMSWTDFARTYFLPMLFVGATICWQNRMIAERIRESQLKSRFSRVRRSLENREPLSRIKSLVLPNRTVLSWTNEDQQALLHLACAYHVTCFEIIRFLVQECPAAARIIDKWKKTPLLEACLNEPPLAVVQLLVQQFPRAVEMVDALGRTPLHQECLHRPSLAVVQYFARRGPLCCLASCSFPNQNEDDKENKDAGRLPLDCVKGNETVVPFLTTATVQAISLLAPKKECQLPFDVSALVLSFLKQDTSSIPCDIMPCSYERSTTAESMSTVSTSDKFYRLRVQLFCLVLRALNV